MAKKEVFCKGLGDVVEPLSDEVKIVQRSSVWLHIGGDRMKAARQSAGDFDVTFWEDNVPRSKPPPEIQQTAALAMIKVLPRTCGWNMKLLHGLELTIQFVDLLFICIDMSPNLD